MNLFLDTNAVVKLYHSEAGSEKLLNFISIHADNLFITISDLTRIEFRSTFLRRVRTGEIPPSLTETIFGGFDADVRFFNVVEVDRVIKNFAITLLEYFGAKRSLRTLDAVQLSTAIVSHQYFPIDCFLTSDQKLISLAEGFFTVFDPEK